MTFKSPEFNNILDKIKEYLKTNDVISEEQVQYFSERYDFTYQEFLKVCDLVSENVEGEKINGVFPEYIYKYAGLEFSLVIGQGAAWAIIKDNK